MKKLILSLALALGCARAQTIPPPITITAPTPTFANFVPMYTFVTVSNDVATEFNQLQYTVNPIYCLDPTSAAQLATLLAPMFGPVTIFYTGPAGWTSNYGAQVSSTVPWLLFSDGTPMNAGVLSSNWTHGYPISFIQTAVTSQIQLYQSLTASGYNWSAQIQNLPAAQ
jgi:hypothetical protein